MIDTHAHLTSNELFEDVDNIINRAIDRGITRIIVICLEKEELDRAIQLQKKYEMLDIAFGYFPSDAANIKEEDYKYLEDVVKSNILVAIGEIGLDYYHTKEYKKEQQILFRRQLEIAQKYNIPVLIHSRDAIEDTLTIKREYDEVKGILHCYSGSLESSKDFINTNLLISLAGVVTFKNAKTLKEVAINVPLDKVVIETDSPYLTPEPYRGKRNEPQYVNEIYNYVAQLRDIDINELIVNIRDNYKNLFVK